MFDLLSWLYWTLPSRATTPIMSFIKWFCESRNGTILEILQRMAAAEYWSFLFPPLRPLSWTSDLRIPKNASQWNLEILQQIHNIVKYLNFNQHNLNMENTWPTIRETRSRPRNKERGCLVHCHVSYLASLI